MCPPVTEPSADISNYCTNEELFTSLAKMNPGCPLPGNVIPDVNPFCYSPQNLPENIWYLLPSKENKDAEHGFWRPRGEPLRIFSNASIYGWETTHEFYEGQAPHGCKTDWLILEYKITTKDLVGDAATEEASSLCKVSRNNDRLPEHGVEPTADNKNNCIESNNHSQETVLPIANKDTEKGSTSGELQVPDDLERALNDIIDGDLDQPASHEVGYLSEGDYLELLDLDAPRSPSSSDNSSCLTMSSDECFDALPSLKDLEAEDDQKLKTKDADMKFTISDSAQPLHIAVAANSVAALPVEEGILEHDSRDAKAADSKGDPSSSSPTAGSSSSRQSHNAGASSSHQPPSPDSKPKDRGSKRLKRLTKNLFCFMAF